MSATKRYIDDKCEEIAKKTGLSWDEVMNVFNHVNDTLPYESNYNDENHMDVIVWKTVELECEKIAYTKQNVIKTGYIPVEYNHYKELVRKAEAYDKWQINILEEDVIAYIEDVLER